MCLMWLAKKPYRKPVGWLTLFFIMGVVIFCLRKFGDVPPGTVTVLMALVALPIAVAGSSSYEAVRTPQRRDEETEENGGDSDVPHVPRDVP